MKKNSMITFKRTQKDNKNKKKGKGNGKDAK